MSLSMSPPRHIASTNLARGRARFEKPGARQFTINLSPLVPVTRNWNWPFVSHVSRTCRARDSHFLIAFQAGT